MEQLEPIKYDFTQYPDLECFRKSHALRHASMNAPDSTVRRVVLRAGDDGIDTSAGCTHGVEATPPRSSALGRVPLQPSPILHSPAFFGHCASTPTNAPWVPRECSVQTGASSLRSFCYSLRPACRQPGRFMIFITRYEAFSWLSCTEMVRRRVWKKALFAVLFHNLMDPMSV